MGKFGKYPLPKFLMRRLGPVEETAGPNAVLEEPTSTKKSEVNLTGPTGQDKIIEREMSTKRDPNVDKEKGYVFESFSDFEQHVETEEVNEDDMLKEPEEMVQPCEGCSDHPDALSEKAKIAIKKMCDEVLIQEATVFETSDDPNQTYESFLRECTHYMAECLIRAAQNLKV